MNHDNLQYLRTSLICQLLMVNFMFQSSSNIGFKVVEILFPTTYMGHTYILTVLTFDLSTDYWDTNQKIFTKNLENLNLFTFVYFFRNKSKTVGFIARLLVWKWSKTWFLTTYMGQTNILIPLVLRYKSENFHKKSRILEFWHFCLFLSKYIENGLFLGQL